MPTLTKEHFDQQLGKLATKHELQAQTKELKGYVDERFDAVDKKFEAQSKELKHHTDEQVNGLAALINRGFENERKHLDTRLDAVIELLDVRKEIQDTKRRMDNLENKIERALNIKL